MRYVLIHEFANGSFDIDVFSRFKQSRLTLHDRSAWLSARTLDGIFPYLYKMHLLREI